ncbi:MAG TPA: cation:proton antiporter, partial [Pyrinomonadaceae bacterium]
MPPTPGFSFSDRKTYITYVLMLLFGVAAVALILWFGSGPPINTNAHGSSLTGNLWQNFRSPLSVLLIQIVVILAAAGLVSRLFRRLGQPPVMGEMVAGIILGPSVLGFFFP